jgi:hypothetical protein
LLFLITMAAFRIGDHYLDLTDISLMTEIYLLGFSALCGSLYVWSIRKFYLEQGNRK